MLITPEIISWFITGKTIDTKLIFTLFKIMGIKLSESEKKNIKNTFSGKHKASPTTINGINRHFKRLCNNKIHQKFDEIDFYSEIKISPFEHINSCWNDVFEWVKLALENGEKRFLYDGCFFISEIKDILHILNGIEPLVKNGIDEEIVKNYISNNKILVDICFFNADISIKVAIEKIISQTFSLNLMLYLLACMETQDETTFYNLIIETMLSDTEKEGKLKSSFAYCTDLYRPSFSFNQMAKELGIDERTFDFYRKGERSVAAKHINVILDKFGLIYYVIVFLRKFIDIFFVLNNNIETRKIREVLQKYPERHRVALMRFEEYKKLN
jgi:hypothetical protein